MAHFSADAALTALIAWGTCAALAAQPAAAPDATPPTALSAEVRAAAILLDGTSVEGSVSALSADGLLLAGGKEPIAFYEIQELRFLSAESGPEPAWDLGPLVVFRGGGQIVARLVDLEGDVARLRLEGARIAELRMPRQNLAAFRLREAHASDSLLEDDAKKPPPGEDTLYVRRAGLLRVPCVLRSVGAEVLNLEVDGKARVMRRQLVQGAVLSPLASASVDADPPARLDIAGLGSLPVHIVGLERGVSGAPAEAAILLRMPGATGGSVERLPLALVHRATFASDRVVFLSSLEPASVVETPVAGRPFPHRRDRSISGDPLRLDGREFRRGLGVHSRCVLEYKVDGKYRSFAAVLGLDDSARGRGSVTFRVAADGKEIYTLEVEGRAKPVPVSLSIEKVTLLRLEVDYGKDQFDASDHADWADARVAK